MRIVVFVLNNGLKKDMLGKNGAVSRNCRVAGTGYNPARRKTTKLPMAPLSRAKQMVKKKSRKTGFSVYRRYRVIRAQSC